MIQDIRQCAFLTRLKCKGLSFQKSLVYLKEIIGSLFEEHIKNGMKVYWRDSDRDYVRIKSDDGLIIALSEMKNEIYHLYVIADR